jgi:hypothetical protein
VLQAEAVPVPPTERGQAGEDLDDGQARVVHASEVAVHGRWPAAHESAGGVRADIRHVGTPDRPADPDRSGGFVSRRGRGRRL